MTNHSKGLAYVLVTPAHNEEAHIEKTIQSVISQTLLPRRWVIVSDGSTDKTDAIVKSCMPQHPWIEFTRLPEHRDRSFAAKVGCFNAGYQRLGDVDYDVIGNLDADISFDPDYFEFLMRKFREDEKLGVAGTPFLENGYSTVTDSYEGESHVAGGCQLFRRRCFEEVGGYIPVRGGGIDWIAVTTARMRGWTTRSFKEKQFFHYRSLGTAKSNRTASTFNYGKKDYYLGGHPLWEIVRGMYRMTKKPYLVNGIVLMSGYLWAFFTRMERPVSRELMSFHRHEQMQKLKFIVKTLFRFKSIDNFQLSGRSQK